MKNPFRKQTKELPKLKYAMILTEDETKIILYERYMDGISEFRKTFPFVSLIIPVTIGYVLVDVLENDWLAMLLFFVCVVPHIIFYFKKNRKERRYVDEKLRGLTTDNIRKQLVQLTVEERREILEEQASDPEIIKYYDELGKNGEI